MNSHPYKKVHHGRREQELEPKHWLGEGAAGQESLLLELSVVQYFLDQAIYSATASLAHNFSGYAGDRKEKPFAVLVPQAGATGRQLGYLSKRFNVYLCADEADDHAEEAADRFGAKVITGDFAHEIKHDCSLFLFCDEAWEDFHTLAGALREANVYLHDEGKIFVLLLGERTQGKTWICWADGSRSLLSELTENRSDSRSILSPGGMLGRPSSIHSVELSELGALEPGRVNAFLKRNRDFLGKNARELLMARIRDEDFNGLLRQEGEKLGILISWGRT